MSDFEPIDLRSAREAQRQSASVKLRDAKSGEPRGPGPASGSDVSASMSRPAPALVSFDRNELREILNLYGRKVAEGEWRDYAIDFLPQLAIFSIYRRTSEVPLFRIEKNPKYARRQGMYSVVTATGLILKRGHDLDKVISVLDKKLKIVT